MQNERLGMLQVGVSLREVARRFNVYFGTVSRLLLRF